MQKYTVTVDNGLTVWRKEGTKDLHREDGPAVELSSGYKEWYKDGKNHREDGPAIVCANGDKHWYKDGKLHREDGPAVELANGYKEYWLNGAQYPKEYYRTMICTDKVIEIDGEKYKLTPIG